MRKHDSSRLSYEAQVSCVSLDVSRESGHGRDEVVDVERIRGANCERRSADAGGRLGGGWTRSVVDMAVNGRGVHGINVVGCAGADGWRCRCV